MKRLGKFLQIIGVGCLSVALIGFLFVYVTKTFKLQYASQFRFTSIDTMKYSRDNAKNPETLKDIPFYVGTIANLGATHIVIATPYDEEFYPVLKTWVTEARKHHLKVWFRGNFSSWEGWFDYPAFTDVNEHHTLTKAFIARHPDLFERDDIFTPVPEAENGGMGDPRGSDEKTDKFNKFLVASYNSCVDAFKEINVQVHCGYFSTNGDIARDILTPETVKQTGNTIVIDHYVNSAQKMSDDIDYLVHKFPEAQIVIGEFGAPIEDINGTMTEEQQAKFVGELLEVFNKHRTDVVGVNYWLLSGGGTALYNQDKTPRLVTDVVRKYFIELNKK